MIPAGNRQRRSVGAIVHPVMDLGKLGFNHREGINYDRVKVLPRAILDHRAACLVGDSQFVWVFGAQGVICLAERLYKN